MSFATKLTVIILSIFIAEFFTLTAPWGEIKAIRKLGGLKKWKGEEMQRGIMNGLLNALVSQGPRVLVQVLLLATYFYLFGLPALERFEAKEVMIVKTTKDTKGIPFPALTLAVRNQFDKDTCYDKEAAIEDCIKENTRNGSEILKRVIIGYILNKEINLTQEIIKEDFTNTWSGRYYTLKLDTKIGPNVDDDMLFLELQADVKLEYTIFVHDPKYFLFNDNPIALPTIMKRMRGIKKDSMVYKLEMTEHYRFLHIQV